VDKLSPSVSSAFLSREHLLLKYVLEKVCWYKVNKFWLGKITENKRRIWND
jgi:hypothetical protein